MVGQSCKSKHITVAYLANQHSALKKYEFVQTEKIKCFIVYWKYLQNFNASQNIRHCTKKMKFSINYFFSKCDQIRRFLRICSHLLKKSLMENFIFYAVRSSSTSKYKSIVNRICQHLCSKRFSLSKVYLWSYANKNLHNGF